MQLLLRKAKILSAISPHDKQVVEMMYASALDCISDDDPFAFSCRPSLYLSKAAFHLGISFGSKPSTTVEPATTIPPDDIRKARETVSALSRDCDNVQMIIIRQCEQSLVHAELLRLEGNLCDALKEFEAVKQKSTQKSLDNLVSIAEHRVKFIEHEKFKSNVIDELLEDLPDQFGDTQAESTCPSDAIGTPDS